MNPFDLLGAATRAVIIATTIEEGKKACFAP